MGPSSLWTVLIDAPPKDAWLRPGVQGTLTPLPYGLHSLPNSQKTLGLGPGFKGPSSLWTTLIAVPRKDPWSRSWVQMTLTPLPYRLCSLLSPQSSWPWVQGTLPPLFPMDYAHCRTPKRPSALGTRDPLPSSLQTRALGCLRGEGLAAGGVSSYQATSPFLPSGLLGGGGWQGGCRRRCCFAPLQLALQGRRVHASPSGLLWVCLCVCVCLIPRRVPGAAASPADKQRAGGGGRQAGREGRRPGGKEGGQRQLEGRVWQRGGSPSAGPRRLQGGN